MSITTDNLRKTSHFLGMDHGAADIGLALADAETRMAFAYATLKNDKDFLQKLVEIVARENIERIIIGIPSYINRKEVEYPGEKIGKLIERELKIAVSYQDEMFTTKMAQDNLIARGIKGIKKFDDQEAARIILQEWLDRTGGAA